MVRALCALCAARAVRVGAGRHGAAGWVPAPGRIPCVALRAASAELSLGVDGPGVMRTLCCAGRPRGRGAPWGCWVGAGARAHPAHRTARCWCWVRALRALCAARDVRHGAAGWVRGLAGPALPSLFPCVEAPHSCSCVHPPLEPPMHRHVRPAKGGCARPLPSTARGAARGHGPEAGSHCGLAGGDGAEVGRAQGRGASEGSQLVRMLGAHHAEAPCARAPTQTHAHTRAHTRTHRHTHTHAHAYTQTYARTCTHTHARTHTRARVRTHTHTHTPFRTMRRHTASRLPLLCTAQCLTSLTLFGKSAAAVPHGHRLATHLNAIAGLKQVRGCGGEGRRVGGGWDGCAASRAGASGLQLEGRVRVTQVQFGTQAPVVNKPLREFARPPPFHPLHQGRKARTLLNELCSTPTGRARHTCSWCAWSC